RGAVRERLARLDLDGPGLEVVGLDRLRGVERPSAVRFVVDQAGEDVVEDQTTVDFVGVGRDQRVLRLAPVDGDGGAGCDRAVGRACGPAARATGQREDRCGDARRESERKALLLHCVYLLYEGL